jgi:pimeloyl-ACP methyl ester carboxylesterase
MPGGEAYAFVLIHGLWHDGSAFAQVCAELERLGHRAFAPTVRGHAPGDPCSLSHAEGVRSVIDYVEARNLCDIVLVGHSFGGTVISCVAEALGGRIRRLVYSSAFVLSDGESLEDHLPPPIRGLIEELTSPEGAVAPPPFAVWRDAFIGDADPALARRAYETLRPYPRRASADKVPLAKFPSLALPRSYLLATEDVSLPPGEWGYHPRMSSRLGLYRLVQMAGSHSVFVTDPARMARKLVEAGRD